MSRAHISLKTKLASALCQMLRFDEDTRTFVPIIPYEDAKLLSDDQVLSLFQWDHWPIRKEAGGSDEHHNLRPMLIADHRKKTSEIDQPQIAKTKRIQARANGETTRSPRIKSAGFRKGNRQCSASRPIERASERPQ